ncbi:hypothetical protein DMC30DRAFT_418061 [Rhodotorula diobovata]|uniref:Proteophosphoglycan ppg4 n=1 Tax=Rhodotorula diobovata TaxID=5288 RepID=A0A5C5FR00_9BASI|nr:hypothetical protein DMC30DRAFT_418061 [Rhodotorula diobovata]
MKLSLLLLPALALVGVGSLALASTDPLALANDASPQLDKRMKADSVRVEADVRAQVKDAGHHDSKHHGDGQDVRVDVEVQVEVEVDRHGDDIIDGCPRRYHRDRHHRCVPNDGEGGCMRGYHRNRKGICVRIDVEVDVDVEVGPRRGRCPRHWRPNGHGNDGWAFDEHGRGPPSWSPPGWAYFGRSHGWAPYRGWVPPRRWRPVEVFVRIWIRVTWWVPPREWCNYWSSRWSRGWSVPAHWGWHPATWSSSA